MNSILLRTAFALAAYVATHTCAAGTLSIIPIVSAAFENDGTLTQVQPLPDISKFQNRSLIYEVDLLVVVGNLTANERGFLNLGFNVGLHNLTIAADYTPDLSTVDINGSGPGGVFPKYFANGDGGPSTTDYQGIFATIANNLTSTSDPRVTLGQNLPTFLGSLFISWDGKALADLYIKDLSASFNLISGVPTSQAQDIYLMHFGPLIPEPASGSIGMVGVIVILTAHRSRTKQERRALLLVPSYRCDNPIIYCHSL